MTWNPHDPTKPGEFNSWKLHAEKYGDLGVGRGTTHKSYISKPSGGGGWGGWGSSGSSTSSSAPSSYSSPAVSSGVPTRIGGGGGYLGGGGGSRSYSSGGGGGAAAFWGVVGFIGLIALGAGGSGKHEASSPSASTATATGLPAATQAGQTDRNTWERWFAGLSGDYRDGAEYWAGVRSTHPSSGVCALGRGGASADFRKGCLDARSFLVQVDHRRDTEPDYWYGWNYITPPQKS